MNRKVAVLTAVLGMVSVVVVARSPASGAQRICAERSEIAPACGGYNPFFAVAVQRYETTRGGAASEPAIVALHDTDPDDPTAQVVLATQAQVGTVFGMAYDATRGQLYAGAYHKRAAYFGPGGPGQVYRVDVATGQVAPFVVLGAGPDSHQPRREAFDRDAGPFVGKTSLGDLEVDDAGTVLFVANLFDGRIHPFALPDGTALGSFAHGATGESWRRNARLFALAWHDGWLYHGVVDSRESSAATGDLIGVVYRSRADGAEMTEVTRFRLDYARPDRPWRKWEELMADRRTALGQPMLSDIAFTASGAMVLALRDRVTDMIPALARADVVHGAGDLMPVVRTGGVWTVVTEPERFSDEASADESTWGSVAAFPGLDQIVATAIGMPTAIEAGAAWYGVSDGGIWRREGLGDLAPSTAMAGVSGLGDVEALCSPDQVLAPAAQATATAAGATSTAEVATATAAWGATATAIASAQPYPQTPAAPVPHAYRDTCATDNPYLATVCYNTPPYYLAGYDWVPVVGFRDTPADFPVHRIAWGTDVGTVWGLAFGGAGDTIYMSAFHKRLSLFGPAGPGGIYRADVTVGLADTLLAVPNAGASQHGSMSSPDERARDFAGKTSLGGLDVSPDERDLFVMNLDDRRIYHYDLPSGSLSGAFAHGAISETWAAEARPFAVKVHEGLLYHGVVNSAAKSQRPADLRGYVYRSTFDGGGMTRVAEFPLDYERGVARVQGTVSDPGTHEVSLNWLPWKDGDNDLGSSRYQMSLYPQPMLTDIEFTSAGEMAIGLRDRHGDMTFASQFMSRGRYIKPALAIGDTLRGRWNGSTWDVEVPQGGDEYYYDRTTLADESTLGGLAKIPAIDEIVATFVNQQQVTGFQWDYYDLGAVWYDDGGQRTRSENVCPNSFAGVYRRAGSTGSPAADVPARVQDNEWVALNALGDVEPLCGPVVPTATPPPTDAPTPSPTLSPSATPTSTGERSPTPTRTASPTATPVPGRIYLPILLKDRKCDPQLTRIDVVFVIDASLTMTHPTRAGRSKTDAAREAARRFLDRMRFPGDQAAVVSFNETATVQQALTGDRPAVETALDRIRNQEFTRIDLGIQAAHGLLTASSRRGVNLPVMIVLTDGKNNPVPVQAAIDAGAAARAEGVRIYTIGLGDEDVEHDALRLIASRPADYRYAPDGEDLGPIYEALAVEVPCPKSVWWPFTR
jgi:hypothetical protein